MLQNNDRIQSEGESSQTASGETTGSANETKL